MIAVLAGLKGVLLAIAAAVFGTIAHQTNIQEVPVGLILGMSAVLMASISARSLGGVARLVFLISFVGLVFLFSQDLTGDKLIPQNQAGLIWSYGSALISASLTLWPKFR